MDIKQLRKLIREEIESLREEKKLAPVGTVIRNLPGLQWESGHSKVYANTRYSKNEKVVDYKIDNVSIKGHLPTFEGTLEKALKEAGYPDLYHPVRIYDNGRKIMFQVRFPIQTIKLK